MNGFEPIHEDVDTIREDGEDEEYSDADTPSSAQAADSHLSSEWNSSVQSSSHHVINHPRRSRGAHSRNNSIIENEITMINVPTSHSLYARHASMHEGPPPKLDAKSVAILEKCLAAEPTKPSEDLMEFLPARKRLPPESWLRDLHEEVRGRIRVLIELETQALKAGEQERRLKEREEALRQNRDRAAAQRRKRDALANSSHCSSLSNSNAPTARRTSRLSSRHGPPSARTQAGYTSTREMLNQLIEGDETARSTTSTHHHRLGTSLTTANGSRNRTSINSGQFKTAPPSIRLPHTLQQSRAQLLHDLTLFNELVDSAAALDEATQRNELNFRHNLITKQRAFLNQKLLAQKVAEIGEREKQKGVNAWKALESEARALNRATERACDIQARRFLLAMAMARRCGQSQRERELAVEYLAAKKNAREAAKSRFLLYTSDSTPLPAKRHAAQVERWKEKQRAAAGIFAPVDIGVEQEPTEELLTELSYLQEHVPISKNAVTEGLHQAAMGQASIGYRQREPLFDPTPQRDEWDKSHVGQGILKPTNPYTRGKALNNGQDEKDNGAGAPKSPVKIAAETHTLHTNPPVSAMVALQLRPSLTKFEKMTLSLNVEAKTLDPNGNIVVKRRRSPRRDGAATEEDDDDETTHGGANGSNLSAKDMLQLVKPPADEGHKDYAMRRLEELIKHGKVNQSDMEKGGMGPNKPLLDMGEIQSAAVPVILSPIGPFSPAASPKPPQAKRLSHVNVTIPDGSNSSQAKSRTLSQFSWEGITDFVPEYSPEKAGRFLMTLSTEELLQQNIATFGQTLLNHPELQTTAPFQPDEEDEENTNLGVVNGPNADGNDSTDGNSSLSATATLTAAPIITLPASRGPLGEASVSPRLKTRLLSAINTHIDIHDERVGPLDHAAEYNPKHEEGAAEQAAAGISEEEKEQQHAKSELASLSNLALATHFLSLYNGERERVDVLVKRRTVKGREFERLENFKERQSRLQKVANQIESDIIAESQRRIQFNMELEREQIEQILDEMQVQVHEETEEELDEDFKQLMALAGVEPYQLAQAAEAAAAAQGSARTSNPTEFLLPAPPRTPSPTRMAAASAMGSQPRFDVTTLQPPPASAPAAVAMRARTPSLANQQLSTPSPVKPQQLAPLARTPTRAADPAITDAVLPPPTLALAKSASTPSLTPLQGPAMLQPSGSLASLSKEVSPIQAKTRTGLYKQFLTHFGPQPPEGALLVEALASDKLKHAALKKHQQLNPLSSPKATTNGTAKPLAADSRVSSASSMQSLGPSTSRLLASKLILSPMGGASSKHVVTDPTKDSQYISPSFHFSTSHAADGSYQQHFDVVHYNRLKASQARRAKVRDMTDISPAKKQELLRQMEKEDELLFQLGTPDLKMKLAQEREEKEGLQQIEAEYERTHQQHEEENEESSTQLDESFSNLQVHVDSRPDSRAAAIGAVSGSSSKHISPAMHGFHGRNDSTSSLNNPFQLKVDIVSVPHSPLNATSMSAFEANEVTEPHSAIAPAELVGAKTLGVSASAPALHTLSVNNVPRKTVGVSGVSFDESTALVPRSSAASAQTSTQPSTNASRRSSWGKVRFDPALFQKHHDMVAPVEGGTINPFPHNYHLQTHNVNSHDGPTLPQLEKQEAERKLRQLMKAKKHKRELLQRLKEKDIHTLRPGTSSTETTISLVFDPLSSNTLKEARKAQAEFKLGIGSPKNASSNQPPPSPDGHARATTPGSAKSSASANSSNAESALVPAGAPGTKPSTPSNALIPPIGGPSSKALIPLAAPEWSARTVARREILIDHSLDQATPSYALTRWYHLHGKVAATGSNADPTLAQKYHQCFRALDDHANGEINADSILQSLKRTHHLSMPAEELDTLLRKLKLAGQGGTAASGSGGMSSLNPDRLSSIGHHHFVRALSTSEEWELLLELWMERKAHAQRELEQAAKNPRVAQATGQSEHAEMVAANPATQGALMPFLLWVPAFQRLKMLEAAMSFKLDTTPPAPPTGSPVSGASMRESLLARQKEAAINARFEKLLREIHMPVGSSLPELWRATLRQVRKELKQAAGERSSRSKKYSPDDDSWLYEEDDSESEEEEEVFQEHTEMNEIERDYRIVKDDGSQLIRSAALAQRSPPKRYGTLSAMSSSSSAAVASPKTPSNVDADPPVSPFTDKGIEPMHLIGQLSQIRYKSMQLDQHYKDNATARDSAATKLEEKEREADKQQAVREAIAEEEGDEIGDATPMHFGLHRRVGSVGSTTNKMKSSFDFSALTIQSNTGSTSSSSSSSTAPEITPFSPSSRANRRATMSDAPFGVRRGSMQKPLLLPDFEVHVRIAYIGPRSESDVLGSPKSSVVQPLPFGCIPLLLDPVQSEPDDAIVTTMAFRTSISAVPPSAIPAAAAAFKGNPLQVNPHLLSPKPVATVLDTPLTAARNLLLQEVLANELLEEGVKVLPFVPNPVIESRARL